MSDSTAISDIKQMSLKERFLIAALCYINIIVYIDRIGIAAVLVEIQDSFKKTDSYGGFLQTMLLLSYTLSAPIFGFCGDRYSRKWILVACTIFWTTSTVGGALSNNPYVLVFSRALMGIGQSGFVAVAPSVISDVVLRGGRSVILAVFFFGIPVGVGLGYVVIAFASNWAGHWRYGLCFGPILNVVGITMLCFATFPKRGEKEATEMGTAPHNGPTTVARDILYIIGVPTYNLITCAFTIVCFMAGALSWWMPKTLYIGFKKIQGEENVTISKVSLYFGTVTTCTGILGVLTGLLLSRTLRPRFPRIDPIICGVGLFIACPILLATLMIIALSQIGTLTLIFFGELCLNLNWAIFTDILLYVIVPHRRTTAQGFSMLITHSFGDCFSPYLVGYLTDFLRENVKFPEGFSFAPAEYDKSHRNYSDNQEFHALQLSLFSFAFLLLLGSVLFLFASRYVVEDSKKARQSYS